MKLNHTLGAAAILVTVIGLSASCANEASKCDANGTCPPNTGGAGGTTTSESGSGGVGEGGTTSSGGTEVNGGATQQAGSAGTGLAGTAGTIVANAGAAGLGTAGTAGTGTAGATSIPCDGTCAGATPYCDETNNTCAACLDDANCPATAPACDKTKHACVGCMEDSHCPVTAPACKANTCVACTKDTNCSGAAPACDTETNVCVPCTGDKYCPTALPACNANKTCVACTANSHCSGTKPACDTQTNTCVECNTNGDCANVTGRTVCDTARNTCVECLTSGTCTDAAKPQCNTTTKACVACLSNADCKTAAASLCNTTTNTCGPCGADADCSLIAGKTVCLQGATPQANQCVQCTGKKYAACGQSGGKALVCDSVAHSCSTTNTVQSSGLCQPCISDAQCTAGKLCYLETFNSSSVGYFCFWKQGDTANGAPVDCTISTNRPYVRVESGAVSIDRDPSTLCTLRSTTCTAYNQFSNLDCAPTGTPQDALCGFAPGTDSKCAQFGTTTYRCTTPCASTDDCKFSCNTGVNPNICTFQ